jgi:imidazolonepropionase-like amidohydrolase
VTRPIVANTSGNAGMVNLAGEVGVIAPGRLADITVLQRPTEISLIIKDGRIVDHEGGGSSQLSEEPSRARIFLAG